MDYRIIQHDEYVSLLRRLENAGIVTINDIFQLSKYVSPNVEADLNTSLSSFERDTIREIELTNLRILLDVFHIVMNHNDPLFCATDRVKYELVKVLKKQIQIGLPHLSSEETNRMLYGTKIFAGVQYAFTNDGTTNLKIWGKIPKKGLFSSRQYKGDEWIKNVFSIFIGSTGSVFRFVDASNQTETANTFFKNYTRAKEMALFYALLYICEYISHHYEKEFSSEKDETEKEKAIRILSDFLNLKTSKLVDGTPNKKLVNNLLSNALFIKFFEDCYDKGI